MGGLTFNNRPSVRLGDDGDRGDTFDHRGKSDRLNGFLFKFVFRLSRYDGTYRRDDAQHRVSIVSR